MKGIQGTLDTKAGNAADLSALLTELLKEAYKETTHSLEPNIVMAKVEVSNAETMNRWLGTRDLQAAGYVLEGAGLNVTT